MSPSSRVAVITGGSEGLGIALARALAQRGYVPVLLARRQDALDRAVASLRAGNCVAHAWCADVTDARRLACVADEIRGTFGSVSFLANNAGTVHTGSVAQLATTALDTDLDVNLRGSVMVTKTFLPLLEEGGTVLFVASGFGLMAPAGYACYAAAKAGIIAFAEALRRELHARRINVYAAVPGDIDTPGFHRELATKPAWMTIAGARGSAQSADSVAHSIIRQCVGRRFFVFTDWSVRSLYLFSKLLPRRWRDALIDRLFPRPPAED